MKVLLLGQPIVDFLCNEDPKVVDEFSLKLNSFNHVSDETLLEILKKSRIRYKNSGGCVTNTSIGLSNLGTKHSILLNLGKDDKADFYLNNLISDFVTPFIRYEDGITGTVITFLGEKDNNTQRTSAFNHGVSNNVSSEYFKCFVDTHSLLYLSLFSFFEDKCLDLLSYAKNSEKLIVADCGGIKGVDKFLLREVDRMVDGYLMNTEERDFYEQTIGREVNYSGKWFVVKNGKKPTQFYSGDGYFSVETEMHEDIINCLGCGDAFAAGFLSGFQSSRDFYKACVKGNKYASDICLRKGFN